MICYTRCSDEFHTFRVDTEKQNHSQWLQLEVRGLRSPTILCVHEWMEITSHSWLGDIVERSRETFDQRAEVEKSVLR